VSLKRKPNEQSPKKAGGRPESAAPEADQDLVAGELERLEAEDAARASAEQAAGAAVAEPATQQLQRLEREALEWKDRAMRAAADLENYRKRANRERDEALGRGQSEVLGRVIDVVDDLARVAHLEPSQTTSDALHEGMLAIERKFLKLIESTGVERVSPAGQAFDPRLHEAVATLPASNAAQDHTVGAVYQHGYTFKGVLLRPARVAVLTWSGPATGGAVGSGATPDAGGPGETGEPGAADGDVGGEAGD